MDRVQYCLVKMLYQVLEHADSEASTLGGHRESGLQPCLLKECQRARVNPWVLKERDYCLEIASNEEAGCAHRPHLQSAVPGDEPRRPNPSDRRW